VALGAKLVEVAYPMEICALVVAPRTDDGLIVTHGLPEGFGHAPGAAEKLNACPVVVETVSSCVVTLFVPPT
jgi:hypothetical protein